LQTSPVRGRYMPNIGDEDKVASKRDWVKDEGGSTQVNASKEPDALHVTKTIGEIYDEA